MATDTLTIGDAKRAVQARWTLADIDWDGIASERARNNPLLYYLVASASFIESGADLYADNLAAHVRDPVAQRWLQDQWQAEELQHGRALRAYVKKVWPELEWERGYAGFLAEFGPLCGPQALDPSRALEMLARCAIEVGTSTYYTALHRHAAEPVLRSLAGRIRQDEVRHYNHFRGFFAAYGREERIGRLAILRKLLARVGEAGDLDAYMGFKHAWLLRHPGAAFHDGLFKSFMSEVRSFMGISYPYRMAVRMLLQPLELKPALVELSVPLLERAARRLMFA